MIGSKVCNACGLEKPLCFFNSKRAVAGGKKYTMSICKECERIKRNKRYKDNPLSKQKQVLRCAKYYYAKREKIFEMLGGKCCKCGFSDKRAFQIDHISGGGNSERRKYKNKTSAYYSHILDTNGAGYQLLCANCNCIKRIENKE